MVSYPDIPHHTVEWELESHHYKRTFIGKLDRLRISLHGHHKRRLRVLNGVHEVLGEPRNISLVKGYALTMG